jgi:Terminase large subunit, T4likevirus-type, N-terminal
MLMARDMARCFDPVRLAQDCGVTPDPWQAELLRTASRRVLMLCSRQSGKTEVAILKAVWQALFDPGLIVMVSPSQRQSSEIFKRFVTRYGELKDVPELVNESALRCELANGSRVVALPGSEKTTRGYAAVKLAILDEAARIEDDLLQAIRPMLATTNGSLVALTTPAGKRGWFFEAWHGDGDWHRVRVPASECPRISKEFLEDEKKELGAMRFSEEYELEFVDDETAAFPHDIISAAFTSNVKPLWT